MKINYNTKEEYEQILSKAEQNGWTLKKVANLIDGNYLVFDTNVEPKIELLKKENQQQGIDSSEREINEIIQGMQISDLEIQLLELQLGGI